MEERFSRRRALKLAALMGVTATAGCRGDDDEAPGEPNEDESPAAENGASSEEVDEDDNISELPVTFDHPEQVYIDEQFSVTVENVPAEVVDVEVALENSQVQLSTSATYEIDGDTLDLDSAEPEDRPFGPGAMRLLQRADADSVPFYEPHLNAGDKVSITVRSGGETVGSTTIERTFGDINLSGTDSDEFVGTVIEPPGDTSVPGVILLHGSGGRPVKGTAQVLAANGFVALPLQYFDPSGRHRFLPDTLAEVPLEYVESAANWLLDHDRVTGEQVGLWGMSKGGELALLSGSQFDTIGAVVSVNGSGYVWRGVSATSTSSWSYEGEPLDYVDYTYKEDWYTTYRDGVEAASEATLADATIPVEEIDGPVTLVTGGDDRLWNSRELHTVATDRLDEHDQEYTHLVYEDAGHRIRYPYLPATNRAEGNQVVYGGTVAGYAEADSDHWPHVLETFELLET